MARYILIDRASGYIFADTAQLDAFDHSAGTPAEAAQALDAELKNMPADYVVTSRHDDAAIYDVYRADVRGSDAVPAIHDGQDQEMIEAVERDCDYDCSLRRAVA